MFVSSQTCSTVIACVKHHQAASCLRMGILGNQCVGSKASNMEREPSHRRVRRRAGSRERHAPPTPR
eukprot:8643403-Alexandrium_andersonii.AAC.1